MNHHGHPHTPHHVQSRDARGSLKVALIITATFFVAELAGALYTNFGFWDQKVTREQHEAGHFNRLVENKLTELGGIKSLYSDSFYEEETFWRIYSGPDYAKLKARYDPKGRLSDIYRKCVLRQ